MVIQMLTHLQMHKNNSQRIATLTLTHTLTPDSFRFALDEFAHSKYPEEFE